MTNNNLDNEHYKPYKEVFNISGIPEFFKISKLVDNILFHKKYGSNNQLNACIRILKECMTENNISNKEMIETFDLDIDNI